jgi:hypothetical protein
MPATIQFCEDSVASISLPGFVGHLAVRFELFSKAISIASPIGFMIEIGIENE